MRLYKSICAYVNGFSEQHHSASDISKISWWGRTLAPVDCGSHTAALTMRLLVESELTPAGGIAGAGFDELRWPRLVRPGDQLRVEVEVRPSQSRPDQGLIEERTTALNQNSEVVQVLSAILSYRAVRNSAHWPARAGLSLRRQGALAATARCRSPGTLLFVSRIRPHGPRAEGPGRVRQAGRSRPSRAPP